MPEAGNYCFARSPIVGKRSTAVAEFYSSTNAGDCPAARFDAIDPNKLAEDLGAEIMSRLDESEATPDDGRTVAPQG